MSRRTSLPGADELFRSTGGAVEPGLRTAPTPLSRADQLLAEAAAPSQQPSADEEAVVDADTPSSAPPAKTRRRAARSTADRRPTGRERHDEKITVYVSAEELLDLEHARLTLRGDHGLAVDRGRIVREALAVVIADLEAHGESSILVRRLRGL